MITKEDDIFEGVSFSHLLKDIYTNSNKKKKQIDILINELRPFITDASKAIMIVPLLKEYLDIGVKNDELLIKMAAVYQKFLAGENRVDANGKPAGSGGLITDEEKEQLLADVEVIKKEASKMKTEDKEDSDKISKLMEETESVIQSMQTAEDAK